LCLPDKEICLIKNISGLSGSQIKSAALDNIFGLVYYLGIVTENDTGSNTGNDTGVCSMLTKPMKLTKSSPTIQDVAKAAGVSVSTVSRVLNDKDDVAPSTYNKVQQVINELGYASSLAARSMRSRKTNVIGLIMPDVDNPFSIQVMKGVNQAITKFGYDLIIYTGGESTTSLWATREQQYISFLNGSITDGIIIVAPTLLSIPTNYPIVGVDYHPGDTNLPAIIATNREGALSVMDYLITLGHRRIGYIGGRKDLQSAFRRHQGYLDGLHQAGIPVDPDLILDGNFTIDAGYRCGQKLLTMANRPTAIFAANDETALGVIKATQEMGLNIPDDVSLVGFDNSPEAAYYLPAGLTTVDQSVRQMGLAATEMLVKLINGEGVDETIYKVPTQLVVRGSCRVM
jgi:LacI family transcriptional regulator